MKKEILFLQDDRQISASDIRNSLRNLGVRKGDVLMVHQDLTMIGRPTPDFLKSPESFYKKITDVFKAAVGKTGTLLMPTFTYSFLRGERYDIRKTPSTAGVLTEFFRKQKDVVRTPNPNLSFAIWGREKHFFLRGLSKDSYGPQSVFGKMRQKDAKILLFGASFKGGTTFVHHIEYMFVVPYRYQKLIRGRITNGKRTYTDTYEHSMRLQDRYIVIDAYKKAYRRLKHTGILKEVPLGDYVLRLVGVKKYFREGMRRLTEDPTYFLHDDFHRRKNIFAVPKDFRKLQKYQGEFFVPGLDKREVRIVCSRQHAAAIAYLVGFLRNLPIPLKWSYRFVFSRSVRPRIGSVRDVFSIYLNEVYRIDHE